MHVEPCDNLVWTNREPLVPCLRIRDDARLLALGDEAIVVRLHRVYGYNNIDLSMKEERWRVIVRQRVGHDADGAACRV